MHINNKKREEIIETVSKFKEEFEKVLYFKTPIEFKDLYKEKITLSVSGGVDSMVMLFCFIVFKEKYGIEFDVVNFEHGLRGEESVLDSYFVSQFCKIFNIKCHSISLEVVKYANQKSIGIEQAARELRHTYYKEIHQKKEKYILLAHNLNDATESVLMHIFRGSGLKGLIGMSFNDQHIVRPLIFTSRESIENYAEKIRLPYREDSSNNENCYTRNFVRNQVVPLIKTRIMNLDMAILKLSTNMRSAYSILNKCAEEVISCERDSVLIDLNKLSEYENFAGDIVKIAVDKLKSDVDFTSVNIEQIIQLKYKHNGKQINLPHGIIALKAYDCIKLYEYEPVDNIVIDFQLGKFEIGKDSIKFLEIQKVDDYKNGIYFDLEKMPPGSVIRRRKADDIFTNFAGYTMSLSDYLTKKKIPRDERDNLYVVAKGNIVSIIIGMEQTKMLQVTQATKRIIKVIIERGVNNYGQQCNE